MEPITLTPIGVIHSPFREQRGTPIQPSAATQATGQVELLPKYAEGLQDLAGFERIWLIFHLDRARPWWPLVVPYRDTVERGIFSTRAPSRPCPVGLSVVDLVSVRPPELEVRGIDVLDGTPLLDIKPYVPELDSHPGSSVGWLSGGGSDATAADGRFEPLRD